MDDAHRCVTQGEKKFFSHECDTGSIPVIVLFTKFDALYPGESTKLRENGASRKDAKELAPKSAKESFTNGLQWKALYNPDDIGRPPNVTYASQDGADCGPLIKCTAETLDNEVLKQLFVSTQQTNLELCMKYAVERTLAELMNSTFSSKDLPMKAFVIHSQLDVSVLILPRSRALLTEGLPHPFTGRLPHPFIEKSGCTGLPSSSNIADRSPSISIHSSPPHALTDSKFADPPLSSSLADRRTVPIHSQDGFSIHPQDAVPIHSQRPSPIHSQLAFPSIDRQPSPSIDRQPSTSIHRALPHPFTVGLPHLLAGHECADPPSSSSLTDRRASHPFTEIGECADPPSSSSLSDRRPTPSIHNGLPHPFAGRRECAGPPRSRALLTDGLPYPFTESLPHPFEESFRHPFTGRREFADPPSSSSLTDRKPSPSIHRMPPHPFIDVSMLILSRARVLLTEGLPHPFIERRECADPPRSSSLADRRSSPS
ncbi:hypothetical protein DFH29DRAFT_1085061, partial [Suillus ampliporus]